MLLGEFEHTLDEKNRLTLPAKFREAFADGIVVTRGMDGCLFAYAREDFDRLVERMRALDPLSREARVMQRHFFSGANDAELDKQGRVMIPAALLSSGRPRARGRRRRRLRPRRDLGSRRLARTPRGSGGER